MQKYSSYMKTNEEINNYNLDRTSRHASLSKGPPKAMFPTTDNMRDQPNDVRMQKPNAGWKKALVTLAILIYQDYISW